MYSDEPREKKTNSNDTTSNSRLPPPSNSDGFSPKYKYQLLSPSSNNNRGGSLSLILNQVDKDPQDSSSSPNLTPRAYPHQPPHPVHINTGSHSIQDLRPIPYTNYNADRLHYITPSIAAPLPTPVPPNHQYKPPPLTPRYLYNDYIDITGNIPPTLSLYNPINSSINIIPYYPKFPATESPVNTPIPPPHHSNNTTSPPPVPSPAKLKPLPASFIHKLLPVSPRAPISEEMSNFNQQILAQVTSNKKPMIITAELLKMKQSEAAIKLGIPPSTFSKRWRESLPHRKWPFRKHRKLEKSLKFLQQKGNHTEIESIEKLIAESEENLRDAVVYMNEDEIDPPKETPSKKRKYESEDSENEV